MADEIELIDLNEADIETLTTLPGIGPNLAERIVEFRVTVHPFEETIELAAVPGISERMVRQFEDRVTVKYSAPVESDADAGDGLAAAEDSAEETVMTGVGIDETRLAESEEPAAEEEIESVPEAEEGELEPAPSPDEPETEVESEDGGAVEAVEAEESVEGEIGLAEAPPPPEAEPVDAADVEEPTAVEAQVSEKVEPPAAAVSDGEQGARRRGCIVLVIATLLGTVLGTTLTLVILATLNNGTLYFTQADAQLRRDINNANQVQAALDTDLARLTSRLDDVATRIEEMAEEQSGMEQSLENLLADINEIRGDIVSLEGSIEEVDDKLATVAAAAETFDTFLNRLRDLLIDIQGPPPTPTPTSTATSTPSPAPSATPDAEEESILEVSPTSTARATRTPRPTATPFAQPTSTPEPQP